MNLDEAESIAKSRLKEFLLDRENEVKSLSRRLVVYSEKLDVDWVVYAGVLPESAQSLEEFKVSPNLDDSESERAKNWLKVTINGETGASKVEEVCELAKLLK